MIAVNTVLTGITVLAAMCACSPPDLVVDGMAVHYDGQPRIDAQMRVALPLIHDAGRVLAASRNRLKDFDSGWCADVEFEPTPFPCLGSKGLVVVGGCQDPVDPCHVQVAWRPRVDTSALAGELGHLVWELVFGSSGETQVYPQGGGPMKVVLDPEYQQWFTGVNAKIHAALENTP